MIDAGRGTPVDVRQPAADCLAANGKPVLSMFHALGAVGACRRTPASLNEYAMERVAEDLQVSSTKPRIVSGCRATPTAVSATERGRSIHTSTDAVARAQDGVAL